jgi:hypothetical protein
MYIIMNVMSTWRYGAPPIFTHSPSPARPVGSAAPHTAQMQAPPVPAPALPLDSRQQGCLCATSYRRRHPTFFNGHVLGIRGGDPSLCWRRHQRGEILRLRQSGVPGVAPALGTCCTPLSTRVESERSAGPACDRMSAGSAPCCTWWRSPLCVLLVWGRGSTPSRSSRR